MRRDCFQIRRFKGDDAIRTVARVQGEHHAERLVADYDAGRTVEEIKSGIYHWYEKVAQRNCTASPEVLVRPRPPTRR